MDIDWSILFAAVGLALILEGLPYFLFAERMPLVLITLVEQGPKAMRILGACAIILGLLLIYLWRSMN